MKKLFCIFLAAVMLSASLAGCADTDNDGDDNKDLPVSDGAAADDAKEEDTKPDEEKPVVIRKTEFPDNQHKAVPAEYSKYCENGGTVVEFKYKTKDYTGSGKECEKTVTVYLPNGYDENDTEKKYNVMYWMHGGGGSEREVLGAPKQPTMVRRMIDHMMANGDVEPCIIVGCTFNNPHTGDGTACCEHFSEELVNDLIPAIEGTYNTYCESTDLDGIRASRLHRGFGGFSMGAACTWWVFEKALPEVAYFMPTAGDSWCISGTKKEAAEHLRQVVLDYGMTKDDFYIYCGVGANDDLAGPNMRPMVEEMVKLDDVFVQCDNFKDGNFYFATIANAGHAQEAVGGLIYNGLPKFFG